MCFMLWVVFLFLIVFISVISEVHTLVIQNSRITVMCNSNQHNAITVDDVASYDIDH